MRYLKVSRKEAGKVTHDMNIRETLRTLPHSYDDFVESTAECMEEYEDVKNAVLEQLRRKPDSTPSDVLQVVCGRMGMLDEYYVVPAVRGRVAVH